MPTGSGKSAIYQIPAQILKGSTVVVSPLIALQRDQVQSIDQRDAGGAAAVNSIARASQVREAFENLEGGDLEFIFLAPEQFNREETIERVKAASPSLFVVDEAHSISEWGYSYVATRKDAHEIAEQLVDRGVNAVSYHGALNGGERGRVQEQFMNGDADVIVATSAFGRGIDKPDVRFVLHYQISESLDAYYQEVGRAGRDGKPAIAALYYRPEDLNLRRFFAGGGQVNEEQMEQVAQLIQAQPGPLDVDRLRELAGLSKTKTARAINRLEEAGVVERLPTGEVKPAGEAPELGQAAKQAAAEQERNHTRDLERIKKVRIYAEIVSCRREYLLGHFGEEAGPCGNCDNCRKPHPDAAPARPAGRAAKPRKATQAGPFALKSRVVHPEWGKGVVKGYRAGKITVLFDRPEIGERTLSLPYVMSNRLLTAA